MALCFAEVMPNGQREVFRIILLISYFQYKRVEGYHVAFALSYPTKLNK